MRYLLTFLLIPVLLTANGQQQNLYISYAVKGDVTLKDGARQVRLKIGRILNDSSYITVAKGGVVSFLCYGARLFVVNKPGVYLLARFSDSCYVAKSDLTWRYFNYVWDELYTRSADNPNRLRNPGAVVRAGKNAEEDSATVEVHQSLYAINYSTGNFSLSWNTKNGNGSPFQFQVMDSTGVKFYSTTITDSIIPISQFIGAIKPGNEYWWTVTPVGSVNGSVPRVFNYQTVAHTQEYIDSLLHTSELGEDQASAAFRLAFLLENSQYFAEAYTYYQKAAKAAAKGSLYHDKLQQFKEEFRLP